MKQALLLFFAACLAFVLCIPALPAVQSFAEETAAAQEIAYPRPNADTVLKSGDKGDAVCWVQEALNRVLGTELTVDGKFGAKTESALRDFQTQQGLSVTGTADAETVSALEAILFPPAETAPAGTDISPPPAETEPALSMKANPDRDHVFKSYWSAYFRCAKLCLGDLPAVGKMLVTTGKWVLIGLGIMILELLIFAILFGGWKNKDAGNGYVYKYLFTFSAEEAGGCASWSIGILLRLVLLFLLISPVIADYAFLRSLYRLGGWKCFFLALLFSAIRAGIALAVYFAARAPVTLLVYLLFALIAFPFRMLWDRLHKRSTVHFADCLPDEEHIGALPTVVSAVLGICLGFFVYLPDLMVFIAK